MPLYPGTNPVGVDPYSVKFSAMSSKLTHIENMLYGTQTAVNAVPPELIGYINPVWFHTLMGLGGLACGFVVWSMWGRNV